MYPRAHVPASTSGCSEVCFLGTTRSLRASTARRSGPQNCRALGSQDASQFDVITGRDVLSRTSY